MVELEAFVELTRKGAVFARTQSKSPSIHERTTESKVKLYSLSDLFLSELILKYFRQLSWLFSMLKVLYLEQIQEQQLGKITFLHCNLYNHSDVFILLLRCKS